MLRLEKNLGGFEEGHIHIKFQALLCPWEMSPLYLIFTFSYNSDLLFPYVDCLQFM